MNKILTLLLATLLVTSCEIYTSEMQMRVPVTPHYSFDTWYGPDCRNSDLVYTAGHTLYICKWECASYGGHYRTGLEIRFEEQYNNEWRVQEYLSPHNCYQYFQPCGGTGSLTCPCPLWYNGWAVVRGEHVS